MRKQRSNGRVASAKRSTANNCLRIEPLEQRRLLAIDSYFDDGVLTIAAYNEAAVTVVSDQGQVLVNGAAPNSGAVNAADVRQISVIRNSASTGVNLPTPGGEFNSLEITLLSTGDGTSPAVIDQYADALFGADWDIELGMSAEEAKVVLGSGRWQTTSELSILTGLATWIGSENLQDYVDGQMASAGLPSFDVMDLDWLELPEPPFAGESGQGGPETLEAVPTEFALEEPGPALALEAAEGVAISIDDASAEEGDGGITFDVHVDGDTLNGPLDVKYNTSDQSATSGEDYNGVADGTLVIPEGAEGEDTSISIGLLNDTDPEGNEDFELNLTGIENDIGSEGPSSITDGTAIGTIIDDDGGQTTPVINVGDVTVNEDDGQAWFEITISEEPAQAVSGYWWTTDGSAKANGSGVAENDYTAVPYGPFVYTFPDVDATPLSISVPVTIQDDAYDELNETFFLDIDLFQSSEPYATIADSRGTGTIIDNDLPPVINIDDAPPALEGTSSGFRVWLSEPTALPVPFTYTTQDGSAEDPIDYVGETAGAQRLFLPGQVELYISVATVGDELVEPTEDFSVTLSAIQNAAPGDIIATGEITDDDAAPIAVDDEYVTAKNTELMVYIEHVLVNDDDPDDSGTLTAIKVTDPANGTLTLNSDGTFHYIPDTDFTGDDTFTYQAHDGANYSNVALVTIHVVGVNLEIGHGQNDGTEFLSEEDEEFSGAVTVANKNDTDGDGQTDSLDTDVRSATTTGTDLVPQGSNIVDVADVSGFSPGDWVFIYNENPGPHDRLSIVAIDTSANRMFLSGPTSQGYLFPIVTHGGRHEVDLMPIRINPPSYVDVENAPTARLQLNSGNIALWENPWKETPAPVDANDGIDISVLSLVAPKVYWVEALDTSASIKDISITFSYMGTSDTVLATGM